MVHYVFWLFSGGAPASQPASQGGGGGEGGGFPKPPSHPAAARRSSCTPGQKKYKTPVPKDHFTRPRPLG